MKQYIGMVNHVLDNGKVKFPVRKDSKGHFTPVDGGVKTLACPNVHFSHDMRDGFPLLTTKKMAWKSIRVELEGFIKGITDKSWYKDRGCGIWDQWANPKLVDSVISQYQSPKNDAEYLELRKKIQKSIPDLGPIYGYQWRSFNKNYENGNSEDGEDQLHSIVETLRTNPMDRRMVCSAWNPNQISEMALPPCHYAWNVNVIGDELNLFWVQRSADLMLGVPFNIASYGLLLSLLAEDSGFKVGNLSAVFVDCHIYENQVEIAKEHASRTPLALPTVEFPENSERGFDIFEWTYGQVALNDYESLGKLKKVQVVV